VRRLFRRGVVIGAVAGLTYAVWRVVALAGLLAAGPGALAAPLVLRQLRFGDDHALHHFD